MKTMKVALLATAALAAVSVSARADDTAAIKAQLEALTARIAQLEAAPAAPVGYSLLTITEAPATQVPGMPNLNRGYSDTATVVGILPTADVPATTSIEWSGYVRAALVFSDGPSVYQGEDNDTDIYARSQLKVVAKTDTAVGEVGALISLRSNFDGKSTGDNYVYYTRGTYVNDAWGWWQMTPELTFGGGYSGSAGNVGYGYDGACTCYYTDWADVAFNPGDTTQFRLTWASGPIAASIAIEDGSGQGPKWGDFKSMGVAGNIKWTGDTFNAALYGEAKDDGDHNSNDTIYQLGAGAGFSLGDMLALSIAGAIGQTEDNNDWWGVSGLASINLAETAFLELGAGYKDYDGDSNPPLGPGTSEHTVTSFLGGLYYRPADQLTIGLEGEWIDDESASDNSSIIDFVTKWQF